MTDINQSLQSHSSAGVEDAALASNQFATPSGWGLSPIVVFLLLVVSSGLINEDFTAMPTLTAFMITVGYALILNPGGSTLSLTQKVDLFCSNSGNRTIILMVMVFLLAGAFYSLTIDIGARDATVNLGLAFVPEQLLLPGLFLISCVISFAMGTSMGTITAIAPIGIGLAESIGIPVPMALGIVIGGAMFGDNLSFISDTTIAATRTQGVKMTDKFRVNLLITLPAVALTFVALLFVEFGEPPAIPADSYRFVLVVPYLLIIAVALTGMNVLAVLGIGIAAAGLVGLGTGAFDVMGMLGSIQQGIGWMQNLAIIALVVGGLVGLMRAYGGIAWLLNRLTRSISTRRQAEFRIAALASLLDISVANNTIAIVTAGPVARELSEEFDVDPRRTAGLLDIFSCGFQGLIPYGGQMLTTSALAGVSPLVITAYCWYPMLILLSGLVAIALGWPRLRAPHSADFGAPIAARNMD